MVERIGEDLLLGVHVHVYISFYNTVYTVCCNTTTVVIICLQLFSATDAFVFRIHCILVEVIGSVASQTYFRISRYH